MGTSKILIDGVGIDLTQDTVAADKMLSDIKAHDASGDSVTGSIASKAASTYTPGTSDQTIAAGQYLSGAQTIKGDANLVAENIRQDKSIFGVAGSLVPGKPIEISTETEMTDVLISANVGKAYKYIGTTGTYTNGDIYVVEVI